MNIFKRIKNLWALSEYGPMKDVDELFAGDIVSPIHKRQENVVTTPKMAQIIKKKKDPIEEFIKENQ